MTCRALILLLIGCGLPTGLGAQTTSGSAAAAVAGGALGLYSGTILGVTGSIVPCSQTYAGARCVRWSAALAGTVGLASGIVIGAGDSDAILRSGKSAAIGFGVGTVTGLVLKPIAQRVDWEDVLAVGLMGGAVGATPKGSAIGLSVGSATGIVLWQTVAGFEMPDAIGAAALGLTLGALADWVVRAADSSSNNGADESMQLLVPFTVWF